MNPIAWLNEAPGRKRGVAAVLLGIGAAITYLGHPQAGQALGTVAHVVDGTGVALAGWGWLHALLDGRA